LNSEFERNSSNSSDGEQRETETDHSGEAAEQQTEIYEVKVRQIRKHPADLLPAGCYVFYLAALPLA
jgi:hypothetical protein